MEPYGAVREAVHKDKSLLSIGCGIGLELANLNTNSVTAVDIVPEYLLEVKQRCPQADLFLDDGLNFLKRAEDKSFDVVSLIDVLEHFKRRAGLRLLFHAKRVARQKVIVYTPEGYVRNEPHHAWGIPAGDEYQRHQSGWEIKELKSLGFKLVSRAPITTQHGIAAHALLLEHNVQLRRPTRQ